MLHDTDLINTITAGLVVAFLAGFVALKLRLPPILGYLLAGVAIGPFTPGYVGDAELAPQLAEIGVILLMFGVGMHFSVRDLLNVRNVAIPGAAAQITVATGLATIVSVAWGWSLGEGLVLGLSISVASTVVLLRALEARNAITSQDGRVAVGWLIVEDLFTVLALVFLPILATSLGGESPDSTATGGDDVFIAVPLAIGKVVVLGLVMFVVGARVIPWLLLHVARTGSRELFTLSVLAVALGIASGAGLLFDVSLALGAFLAGLVVAQSDQSHQAAADALPLRDAFAVLFFVSVGMLFDPAILIDEPARLLAILAIIIVGKSVTAVIIVSALRWPLRTGLVVAAGLAQVGEFSFILAQLGNDLQIVSEDGTNLVLASALLSISVNPLLFWSVDRVEEWAAARPRLRGLVEPRGRAQAPPQLALSDHVVFSGYGRVAAVVARALDRHQIAYVVVERDQQRLDDLQSLGANVIYGDATKEEVLKHAHLESARVLVAVTQDADVNARVAELAQVANPNIHIVVRTGDEEGRLHMEKMGIEDVVMSDLELGMTTIRRILPKVGVSDAQSLDTMRELRRALSPQDPTGTGGAARAASFGPLD
jgi:CPA2 family monovalent cation:H+ antiporter-2